MRSVEILRLAADTLDGRSISADLRSEKWLEALEYMPAQDLETPVERSPSRQRQIDLLRFASQFDDFFLLDSPLAPGLACFGAQVSPLLAGERHRKSPSVSVTGRALTPRRAFEGCVGEAIEFVSQWEREHDLAFEADFDQALAALDPLSRYELEQWVALGGDSPSRIDWLEATRLSDGASSPLPVDFCLRRPAERRALQPPFLMGTGTAAGETFEAATLHAVLELIERDALGLWWKGGRRGFSVDPEAAEFDLTINALRRGAGDRQTWLLDITTDLGVPCIVAVSCSAVGDEFAFGAAARPSVSEAARAALLEVCQLELALHLVQRKRQERGDKALNEADRRHLLRAAEIDPSTCALAQPLPHTRPAARQPAELAEIVAHASQLGVEFHRVDITRKAVGVPAVRVVAPALQMEPSQVASTRLRRVIAATGGGDVYHGGAQLL